MTRCEFYDSFRCEVTRRYLTLKDVGVDTEELRALREMRRGLCSQSYGVCVKRDELLEASGRRGVIANGA
jgi:hypothetical protein